MHCNWSLPVHWAFPNNSDGTLPKTVRYGPLGRYTNPGMDLYTIHKLFLSDSFDTFRNI